MTEFNVNLTQVIFEVGTEKIEFAIAFQSEGSGESNDIADAGLNVHQGLVPVTSKVGANLQVKGLRGGTGVVIVDDAVDNVLVLSASGVGTVIGPVASTINAPAVYADALGQTLKDPDAPLDFVGQSVINVGTVDGRDVSVDGTTLDTHVADTANPHTTDIGNLGPGTLAELNTTVTDATLDDITGSRTPSPHAASHSQGGSDGIDAADLGSGVALATQVLTADGAGGVDWAAGAAPDVLVKITAADTTAGFLDDKIVDGDGLLSTILNPGVDEDLELSVVLTDTSHGNLSGGLSHAAVVPAGASGFMTGADKTKLDGIEALAKDDQTITAGTGMTGGGLGDVTLDVIANADGSIVVNPNDLQVGVLANDAQHGVRGGGTQHADVIAAGPSGFMTGVDKTKIDGVASGAQPGDIVGPGVVVVDEGLPRWDGTTGDLVQDSNVSINDTGDILPSSNNTQDVGAIGSVFTRGFFESIHAVQLAGTGAVTFGAGQGSLIGGRAQGPGVNELVMSGTFPPALLAGNALSGNPLGNARMNHQGGGGVMVGSAYTGSGVALIESSNTAYGAFTGGYAFSGGGSASLINNAAGSFMWAYVASGGNTGSVNNGGSALGCFTQGRISGGGTFVNDGAGAFVQGLVTQTGNISTSLLGDGGFAQGRVTTGDINANANGAFAQGNVNGSGSIVASGQGSFAHGNVTTGLISATAQGSFAVGRAATGTISATANNAVQFGIGTNALADSAQFGDGGLRMNFSTGTPGAPQNGDVWVANNYVYIRSNGVSVQIT